MRSSPQGTQRRTRKGRGWIPGPENQFSPASALSVASAPSRWSATARKCFPLESGGKPGSVPAFVASRGWWSFIWAARCRTARATNSESGIGAGHAGEFPRDPSSVLLQVGFAVPPLSPGGRCALTTPFHPCPVTWFPTRLAVYFLLHFPSSHLDWPLASTLPKEPGLSSTAQKRRRDHLSNSSGKRAKYSPGSLFCGESPSFARRGPSREADCSESGQRGWQEPSAQLALTGFPLGSRRRLVFHQVFPIDDAMAVGAGLDGIATLKDVEELGRHVHVAALARAIANRGDGQRRMRMAP